MSDHLWHVLEQGRLAASYNMALDDALLEGAAGLGHPLLRFYGWTERAATFGYAQKISEIENWTMLRPLIRRPTGGGLVPHDSDWTYSVIIPPSHAWYGLKATESYQRVHEWVRDAFLKIKIEAALAPEPIKEIPGQCFVGAERHDVLWHGRKIAGAAQRRTRAGLLIQGSVQPPPISVSRPAWQQAMREVASARWEIRWQELALPAELARAAAALDAVKYSQVEYNRKR